MASELAAMYVSIIPSAKGMQQNIGKELAGVESQAASTGQSMGSKLAGGMAKTMKVGALAAGGAVAGILGTAIVKGFSRLSALENAQAKLTGLGHSAGTVTGIMENALAAVKGTAFGMDEAASAAAGAVAAGIKPGAELEGVLRLMGDAATIAGTDMGSMGAIFNKVASSNKIQGDVIAQLQDQGIPIVQLMAKELGVTAEETIKLASDGEISFEVFRKAMENGMGGAALESGKTVSGAFKNMNAALGRFGAALLKDTYPLIGPVFSSLTTWIDKGTAAIGPLAAAFSGTLFGSLQSIWGIISRRDFTGPIFGLEEDHAFIGYMFTLRDAVVSSFDKVKTAFGEAKSFVAATWAGFTMDPAVAASYGEGLSPVVAFGVKLREVFDKLLPAVTQLGAPLLGLVLAFSPLRLVFEALLPVLPQLAGMLADLFVVGTDLAVVISGALVGALTFLTPIISDIITNVAGLVSGITSTQGGLDLLKGVLVTIAAAWVAYQIGVVASTIATNAYAFATNAMSFASKAAAAAQWLMNAALTANPIGIVVVAVAALVAGLVYFFTQTETGRAIIETVWGAIKTFIGGIVVWFQTYVLPVIQSVFNAVGSVFSWLYENVIKPVFDGVRWYIGAVVTWFQTYVLPVIQKVFSTVGDVFSWLYNNVVKPVFDGIKWWIGVWWTAVSAIFQLVVALFRNVLGPTFEWLWNGVAKPVFDAIGQLIGAFWNLVVKPIFEALISFIRNVLAVAFTWLRDNVISPVWTGIQVAISVAWNNYIRPIFDAIGAFIRNILAPAFTWLRDNVIRPVWDWISSKISDVWNDRIKPVFELLKKGVEAFPGAFEAAKNGIGRAWDAIKAKVKEPIVAVLRFINEDLIGKFNSIPGVNIKPLQMPPGFRDGGYTGDGPADAFAGHVHKGEYVFTKEQTAALGKERLAQMAHAAVRGGEAAPGSSVYGGIPSFGLGNFATQGRVKALSVDGDSRSKSHWFLNQATEMWNGLANVKLYTNGAGPSNVPRAYSRESANLPFAGIPNWAGYYSESQIYMNPSMANMPPTARRTVTAHEVGHALGLPHAMATGAYSIMNYDTMYKANKPTAADVAALRTIYGEPGAGNTATSVSDIPDGESSNPFVGLIDTIMAKIKEAFPEGGMFVDVAGGLAKAGVEQVTKIVTDIKDGISKIAGDVFGKVKDFFGGGGASIAPTLYDKGGILAPGDNQLVSNRTRKPEAIFTNEEAKALVSGRGNSEPTVHLHVENMFDSAENIVGELRTEIRRGVTSHNLRQVARVG